MYSENVTYIIKYKYNIYSIKILPLITKLFRPISFIIKAALNGQMGICLSRPSALGPICRPSTPRLALPGPIKLLSAVSDFLLVCVIKCSCAALIKRNCEFSNHKY